MSRSGPRVGPMRRVRQILQTLRDQQAGWDPKGRGERTVGQIRTPESGFAFYSPMRSPRSGSPTKARPGGTPGVCRRRAEPTGCGLATVAWKNSEARSALPLLRLGKLDLEPRP